MTPQNAIQIKITCSVALATASGQTDADEKYSTIQNAYEQVRTLQGAAEATDFDESVPAALTEYLTESLSNADKILAQMAVATASMDVVPDPLPDGLVFVTTGGSGSGSGS